MAAPAYVLTHSNLGNWLARVPRDGDTGEGRERHFVSRALAAYTDDKDNAESYVNSRQLRDLKRWTGWSNQLLGEILNIQELAIDRLINNASHLFLSNQAQIRLAEAHRVIHRVYLLTEQDRNRTATALQQQTFRGASALEHLVAGRADHAYLAALDAIRPPRQGRMMTGQHPLDPRDAVVAIHDKD